MCDCSNRHIGNITEWESALIKSLSSLKRLQQRYIFSFLHAIWIYRLIAYMCRVRNVEKTVCENNNKKTTTKKTV